MTVGIIDSLADLGFPPWSGRSQRLFPCAQHDTDQPESLSQNDIR